MLMGYRGEKGRSAGVAWPDPVAGMHAAAATVVAILERLTNPAKGGGTVEVAQIEATVAMAGAAWRTVN
jgi:crotonobetainyl-CoA:carnitine CoA-transferase CaiB-like acyl-CoA transferase